MVSLLLLATLSCPKEVFINVSKYPWNDWDRSRIIYARKVCRKDKISPCMKWFKKWGKQDYSVLCTYKR